LNIKKSSKEAAGTKMQFLFLEHPSKPAIYLYQ
jgi:hypothetical protein